MSKSVEDPFNVVLKASKLPMSLLKDADKQSRMKLLQVTASSRFFSAEIREVFRVLRVVFVLSPCKKNRMLPEPPRHLPQTS